MIDRIDDMSKACHWYEAFVREFLNRFSDHKLWDTIHTKIQINKYHNSIIIKCEFTINIL